jgi:epoxide hydrolase-like predicted phosphatase
MSSGNGSSVPPPPGAQRSGLLVDWGGVMTTSVFETFQGFCEAEGLSADEVAKRFRHDPESRELLVGLEDGTLPEEEFEPRFAALLGVPAPALIDRMFSRSKLEPAMLTAVRRARGAGVRTGLISNSWGTRRYDRQLLAGLFDGMVISGEVGIRKPAPEIYALGTEQIGLAPTDCVFVDDLPFNLKPAAQLGMATVHHRDVTQTIGELQRLLAVDLT